MDQDANFTALRKAYPMEISGQLLSYHYDASASTLDLTYDAKPGESKVYLPFIPSKDYNIVSLSDSSCLCLLPSAEGRVSITIR